jgi:triacylglycerol lipase
MVVPRACPAGASSPAPARRPVVVVAGLLQNADTVAPMAGALRGGGLDVTVWLPPHLGLIDVRQCAVALGRTVDAVRRRTGADQVDLVGHSQGGVTARQFVKFVPGGAGAVHTLVSLGSPQQGTAGGAMSQLLRLFGFEVWSPACRQMVAGSRFLAALNGEDPTPGAVRYVSVGTARDGVVQPVWRSAIPGAEHVVVGACCPDRAVGHFGLLQDAYVHEVVASVLAGGPAAGDCGARPFGGPL